MSLGISQSKVPIPENMDDRGKKRKESKDDALEIHKFLYITKTVFPPPEIRSNSNSQQFTLPAGSYSYDFSIVIPDYLDCEHVKQPGQFSLSRFVVADRGIDYAREATLHIQGQLPPSLSDMEKVASIRYFLKATVSFSAFLRTNIRVYNPIVFLPPDSLNPHTLSNTNILFVRRNLLLSVDPPEVSKSKKGKGISSWFSSSTPKKPGQTVPITLEMRYPGNATFVPLRCGLPIKLFVISTQDPNSFNLMHGPIMFQDLIIKLFAVTDSRAQQYTKESVHSITIGDTRHCNISIDWSKAVQRFSNQNGTTWEIALPDSLWKSCVIPDFVPPSFKMCNVQRRYNLEVTGGMTGNSFGEVQYVSVIADIHVMSGIARKTNPKAPIRPELENTAPNYGVVSEDVAPPAYDAIVSPETVASERTDEKGQISNQNSSGSSNQGPSSSSEPRRTYGQNPVYYEKVETFDT